MGREPENLMRSTVGFVLTRRVEWCIWNIFKKICTGVIGIKSPTIFSARKIGGHVTFGAIWNPSTSVPPSYGEITWDRFSNKKIKYSKSIFYQNILQICFLYKLVSFNIFFEIYWLKIEFKTIKIIKSGRWQLVSCRRELAPTNREGASWLRQAWTRGNCGVSAQIGPF